METTCPNCGTTNRNTSRFCAKCGTELPRPEGSQPEGGLNLPWLQAVQEKASKQTGGLSPEVAREIEAATAKEPPDEKSALADEPHAVQTPPEGAPPQPGGEGTPDEPPPDWVVGILEPSAKPPAGSEQSYEPEEMDHIMPWLSGVPEAAEEAPKEEANPELPPWLVGVTVQETLQTGGAPQVDPDVPLAGAAELDLEGLEPFVPPGSEEQAGVAGSKTPEKVPDWLKPLAPAIAAENVAEGAAGAASGQLDSEAAARSGLDPTETLMASTERNIPVRSPRAGSVETLAALMQVTAGEPVRRPVPGMEGVLGDSASQRGGLRQWLISDRLVYVIILAALLAVLIIKPPFGEQNAPGALDATQFYNAIEKAPDGKPVLLVYDWDAGRSAEMFALSEAVTQHLMMRRLPFVTVSLVPFGAGFAQLVTDAEKDAFGYEYGRDYLVLGYLPGSEAALGSLVNNFGAAMLLDYANARKLDTYSLAQSGKISSLENFGLIVELASDEGALRNWIEQVATRTDVPIIAAVPQGLEPVVRPYKNIPDTGLTAVLSGQSGAMRYMQQLSQRGVGPTGTLNIEHLADSLNALSVAQILVALAILAALVNLGMRKILRR